LHGDQEKKARVTRAFFAAGLLVARKNMRNAQPKSPLFNKFLCPQPLSPKFSGVFAIKKLRLPLLIATASSLTQASIDLIATGSLRGTADTRFTHSHSRSLPIAPAHSVPAVSAATLTRWVTALPHSTQHPAPIISRAAPMDLPLVYLQIRTMLASIQKVLGFLTMA
jgi:hypothetical protein